MTKIPGKPNSARGRRGPPSDYEVGFGRPPKDKTWKKGQSGNKSGLPKIPKATKQLSVVAKVLSRAIPMTTENGATTYINALEALHQKQLELGLKGNMRAILSLIDSARTEGLIDEPEKFRLALMWAGSQVHVLTDEELEKFETILIKLSEAGKKAEAAGKDPNKKRVVHGPYRVGEFPKGGMCTKVHYATSAQDALLKVVEIKSRGLGVRIVDVEHDGDITEDQLRAFAQEEG